MEQHSTSDLYCTTTPFNPIYTQLNNNDYPKPAKPEVMEVIEEAMDIEATIKGDVDLGYVKFRVKLNDYSFVGSGLWLWKVRYYKLYKKTHKNFKDWCNDVVGKNYTTVLDMIKAALVWMKLSTRGIEALPYSIAQCVTLYKYIDDEETFFANWELITSELQECEYSATAFAAVIEGRVSKKSTVITFPVDLFDKLYNTAVNVGLSIIELVRHMHYEMFQKVVCAPPDAMERWELDLELMVKEQDALLPSRSTS